MDVIYCGAHIWCAAYAFFNTLNIPGGSPETYELLSSVPFGLRHSSEGFKRLITTYANPNNRIERTARLLGYNVKTQKFVSAESAVEFLRGKPTGKRYMIGPVDMGRLIHLPQCLFYSGQDHYFTAEIAALDKIYVIDSEGICFYIYSFPDFKRILSVADIPEADGLFHIREFEKEYRTTPKSDENELNRAVLRGAAENMCSAQSGSKDEGGNAFIRCFDVISGVNPVKWKLSLTFDLHFILQRKFMLKKFLRKYACDDCRSVLSRQIELLSKIRQTITYESGLCEKYFREAAELEAVLTGLIGGLEEKICR